MKNIIFGLIFGFSLLVGQTLVVDKNYYNGGVNCLGNSTNTYTTIQSAINSAYDGDAIMICPGIYNESITLSNKGISLIGVSGNRNDVVITQQNGVTISITNWPSKLIIKNITIESNGNDAINFNNETPSLIYFENVSIKAKKKGVHFQLNIFGKFNIKNSLIESEEECIEVNGYINDNLEFKDLILQGNKGIYIGGDLYGSKNIFESITIKSDEESIYIGGEVSGKLNLKELNITSNNSDAVKIEGRLDRGLLIEETNIISYLEDGLEVKDDIDPNPEGNYSLWIKNSSIRVKKRALNLDYGKQVNVKLENSYFESSSDDTIKLKLQEWYSVIAIGNCFRTLSSGNYAFYLDMINSNDVDINNNCFYANGIDKLAKSTGSGYDWNGNYWYGFNGNSYNYNNITDNNPLLNCNSCSLKPIANYQMDECNWTGTIGEVKDSSENGYDGIAKNGATTSEGKICSGGKFDGSNDYIKLSNFPNLTGARTITAWIKTLNKNKSGQRIFADDEINGNGNYALSLGDGGSGRVRFYIRGVSQVSLDSNPVIDNNKWYFVVAIYNDITKTKRLIVYDSNGNKLEDKTQIIFGKIRIPNGTATIGGETDNGEINNRFKGYIDEVKIWNLALNDFEIDTIYNNEKNGRNFNGLNRVCFNYDGPITSLEFEGSEIELGNTTVNFEWTHIEFNKTFSSVPVVFILPSKKGQHPASVRIKNVTVNGFDAIFAEPQGEDGPHLNQNINYLAINKGVHKIGNTYFEVGTINTKKIQQKNISNEWEKIDHIFKNCMSLPVPVVAVAQIQSINNETGLDPNGIKRSKPWMTTAIEVNSSGVYVALERSETNEGSITEKETIGYMIAPANIQDNVIDDYGNNIKFETIRKEEYFVGWDNSCKKVNFVHSYSTIPLIAANKNSKKGADGGWFRRCYLDKNKIGLLIDEDGAQSSNILYGYSEPPQDRERSHIAETGGIFVFSDTIIIHQQDQTNSTFDAWDTFRSVNDKNISTKIVNKDFNLTIASLDQNGSSYQDFNGTVCVTIVDDLNNSYTPWYKLLFNDQNSSILKNINIPSAIKEAKVLILWKKDINNSCPLTNEDNLTLSTDSFAIRPDKFDIETPSIIKAGEEFNITIKALGYNGESAKDYNESISNIKLEYNETKSECKIGTLEKVSEEDFINGEANITLKYSEVGDINVTIKEINGSEFALIDSDDTNNLQRFINPITENINIVVDHFEINATYLNHNKDNNFTYLDENLTIASILDINITAKNKDNETLENYNKECYAKEISINISHSNVNDDNITKIIYKVVDVENNQMLENIQKDNNISFVYKEGNFTTDNNGTTFLKVYINFDRNISKAVNPFEFNIIRIDVNDTDSNGSLDVNKSANYYYGNLLLKDIIATKNDFIKSYNFLIYDNNNSDNLKPSDNELLFNWYENIWHKNSDGNVTDDEIVVSSDYNASNELTEVNVSITSIGNGEITFDISRSDNNIKFVVVHLLSENLRWFWYSKFDKPYDISNDSTCLNHFCFAITWEDNNEVGKVGSGEFSGTEANVTEINTTKRGIKIFR